MSKFALVASNGTEISFNVFDTVDEAKERLRKCVEPHIKGVNLGEPEVFEGEWGTVHLYSFEDCWVSETGAYLHPDGFVVKDLTEDWIFNIFEIK